MKILIPTDKNFNYSECKKLFEDTQHLVEDYEDFFDVINNTYFYSFFVNGKHIGFIYYYEIDNKLFVNAVAYRKTHLINLECFKKSLSWWNCDIYARTNHKTAIYAILKCGFKKIGKNLYKYERIKADKISEITVK